MSKAFHFAIDILHGKQNCELSSREEALLKINVINMNKSQVQIQLTLSTNNLQLSLSATKTKELHVLRDDVVV